MKHTILFLAANPVGTDRLVLDREARAIHVDLERSGFRDSFVLETRWAAEPLDLLRESRGSQQPTTSTLRRLALLARRTLCKPTCIADVGSYFTNTSGTRRATPCPETRRQAQQGSASAYPDGQAQRGTNGVLREQLGCKPALRGPTLTVAQTASGCVTLALCRGVRVLQCRT